MMVGLVVYPLLIDFTMSEHESPIVQFICISIKSRGVNIILWNLKVWASTHIVKGLENSQD